MKKDTPRRGQPRKYKTEAERAEAKRRRDRAYGKTYYARVRKPKMDGDKTYRKLLAEQERQRYQENHPEFEAKNFGGNAGKALRFSDIEGGLSVDATAKFLNTESKVLGQWIESGKFPRPKLRTGDGQGYYSVDHANALALVFKRLLPNRASFRKTDKEVIAELHKTTL